MPKTPEEKARRRVLYRLSAMLQDMSMCLTHATRADDPVTVDMHFATIEEHCAAARELTTEWLILKGSANEDA